MLHLRQRYFVRSASYMRACRMLDNWHIGMMTDILIVEETRGCQAAELT